MDEDLIAQEWFFTAADGVRGRTLADMVESVGIDHLEFAIVFLADGRVTTGVAMGSRDAAREDALRKVYIPKSHS